jgi:hypothetical protein
MLKKLLVVAALATLSFAVSAYADDAEVRAAADKVKDQKLRDHLMSNIDIFGKTDLPAIYILMSNTDGSDDIQGSILTRDFSRDPFFMQNIDREEFELKVTLREINGEDEKDKDALKR